MKPADPKPDPPKPASEPAAVAQVEEFLHQGEPLLAYNAVQEGLGSFPGSLRLRQLRGLAVARSGDLERANRLLRELADEGLADPETLGMLARTHKDLAFMTGDGAARERHLAAASAIYQQAYQSARDQRVGRRNLVHGHQCRRHQGAAERSAGSAAHRR